MLLNGFYFKDLCLYVDKNTAVKVKELVMYFVIYKHYNAPIDCRTDFVEG